MKKEEIIEVVSANPKIKEGLTSQMVEKYIEFAFNQILFDTFKMAPSNMDIYRKTYKNIDVLKDVDTNIYYSMLPAPVAILPERSNGVRVQSMQGVNTDFVPVEEDSMDVFDGLEVGQVDKTMGYIVRNDRVEYYNFDSSITSVKLKMVVPFSSYGYEEDINIPMGKDEQFIQLVITFLLNQNWVKDLSNDGNPKTT
jgi:hypothetical protein